MPALLFIAVWRNWQYTSVVTRAVCSLSSCSSCGRCSRAVCHTKHCRSHSTDKARVPSANHPHTFPHCTELCVSFVRFIVAGVCSANSCTRRTQVPLWKRRDQFPRANLEVQSPSWEADSSSVTQKLSPHFMEIVDDIAGPYSEPNASCPHPRVKFRLRFNIILQWTPRFSKIIDNTGEERTNGWHK